MANDMSVISYLESGIKTEATRQAAIASNIANMNTPGYRRVDVKFNEVLAQKIESGAVLDADEAQPELFQPRKTAVSSDGNDVAFDTEIGEMVKNSIRHKTYTRLLAKKYQQYDIAMNFSR
ncbi:MAG: flagellar basal body rod protein FlgB [Sedimentisphaerales bacterium]|nr:flagellar basal body rod protein FlgB [Sedimentisphaerales bacterium]